MASLQRVSVAQSDQRQLEGTGAILEREALENSFGDPLESPSRSESFRDVEEARWSWRHSKGSVSPSATIRQLEGARRHS